VGFKVVVWELNSKLMVWVRVKGLPRFRPWGFEVRVSGLGLGLRVRVGVKCLPWFSHRVRFGFGA